MKGNPRGGHRLRKDIEAFLSQASAFAVTVTDVVFTSKSASGLVVHHTTRNATVVQYREHVVTAGLRSIKTSIGFGMTNLEQPGWIHVAKSKRATLSREVARSQGYRHHETSIQRL
jgi:hypothetical protein